MLELTQYEALDLARSWLDAIQTDFQVMLTICSAYLVCAYTAGANLTKFQVSVINVGFVFFSGFMLLSFFGDFEVVKGLWVQAGKAHVDSQGTTTEFKVVVGFFDLSAILACLTFMWSVRHPKSE